MGPLHDEAYFADLVDVYWREYHWPAFNVADASITVGVALLAWRLVVPTAHA